MRILALQHEDFEGPAFVGEWAARNSHSLSVVRPDRGDSFPATDEFDFLLILGCLASAHDETGNPWLLPEKEFIRSAVDAGKKVLGFCFGSQLLSAALGGRAKKNKQVEIGRFPLSFSEEGRASELFSHFPDGLEPLVFHGDTFDIPPGATHLFSSEYTPNLGFALGTEVVGLQPLMLLTPETFEDLIAATEQYVTPGPSIQSVEEMRARTHDFATDNQLLEELLDKMA